MEDKAKQYGAIRDGLTEDQMELIRYIWQSYDPNGAGWPTAVDVEIEFPASKVATMANQLGQRFLHKLMAGGGKGDEYRLTSMASFIAAGDFSIDLIARFFRLVRARLRTERRADFEITLSDAIKEQLIGPDELPLLQKLLSNFHAWGYLDGDPRGSAFRVAGSAVALCEPPPSQLTRAVIGALIPTEKPPVGGPTIGGPPRPKRSPSPQESVVARKNSEDEYISKSRISELQAAGSTRFDTLRLVQLCKEINIAAAHSSIMALGYLQRALLDHVPPVFGFESFKQVADHYAGGPSLKKTFSRLDDSLRDACDRHLHQAMRRHESLPTRSQFDFRADVDSLLEEVERLLRSRSEKSAINQHIDSESRTGLDESS